jgi:hypothetical protein
MAVDHGERAVLAQATHGGAVGAAGLLQRLSRRDPG